jgi:hypothetical protein
MKKASKPAPKLSPAKKPPVNKPITKQSSARPMRKAEGHSDELIAVLTRLAGDQRKVGEQVGHLIGITNKLVEVVEHLSEGVEGLLQASEDIPPAEQAEPGNEPPVEAPSEVVGVMVVDEPANGDGEAEEE